MVSPPTALAEEKPIVPSWPSLLKAPLFPHGPSSPHRPPFPLENAHGISRPEDPALRVFHHAVFKVWSWEEACHRPRLLECRPGPGAAYKLGQPLEMRQSGQARMGLPRCIKSNSTFSYSALPMLPPWRGWWCSQWGTVGCDSQM